MAADGAYFEDLPCYFIINEDGFILLSSTTISPTGMNTDVRNEEVLNLELRNAVCEDKPMTNSINGAYPAVC